MFIPVGRATGVPQTGLSVDRKLRLVARWYGSRQGVHNASCDHMPRRLSRSDAKLRSFDETAGGRDFSA